MTDQPQVEEEEQPTGTVQAPPLDEAQATGTASSPREVPAPEAEWRFFVRIQDNPGAANYLEPQSLHRMQITEIDLFTHRFEREMRTWVHNPGMIAFTGMGGADDYDEIDEDKANTLISQWTQEESEEVPETEEAEGEAEKGEIEKLFEEEGIEE